MVSCGMDHSLKIWSLETDAVRKVHQSNLFDISTWIFKNDTARLRCLNWCIVNAFLSFRNYLKLFHVILYSLNIY